MGHRFAPFISTKMKIAIVLALICGLVAVVRGENCGTVNDCMETSCTHIDHHITCDWNRDGDQTHGACTCRLLSACDDGGVTGDCSHTRCHDNDKESHCVEGNCRCIEPENQMHLISVLCQII